MKKKYTKAELLTLLKGYKKHITSASHWNTFCKENDLPHSQTLISYFGSWNKFKEELTLDLNEQSRPLKYTDEELYTILDEQKSHYSSAAAWDAYAEINQLPKHFIFMYRLGPDILHEKTGLNAQWTTEQIKNLIMKHFPNHPPTQAEWNELTISERIPSFMTIIRRFGSWSKMKYEVYYK